MNGYEANKHKVESARHSNGRFGKTLHQEASGLVGNHEDSFNMRPGEGDDFGEYTDGTVMEDLYVSREDDGYVAYSSKKLYDLPELISDSTGLSQEAARWTLEAEADKAREFLAKHYEADVEVSEDDHWSLQFATPLNEKELSGSKAADALWERTKIVAAHNESDHGTFGSDNLGRLLAEALDIRTVSAR